MRGEPQRTALDPLEGIDDVNHIQDGQFVQRAGQDEASVQASLRLDHSGAAQGLEDLGQVAGRDLGLLGNLLRRPRAPGIRAQHHHGSQCVLGSQGAHDKSLDQKLISGS